MNRRAPHPGKMHSRSRYFSWRVIHSGGSRLIRPRPTTWPARSSSTTWIRPWQPRRLVTSGWMAGPPSISQLCSSSPGPSSRAWMTTVARSGSGSWGMRAEHNATRASALLASLDQSRSSLLDWSAGSPRRHRSRPPRGHRTDRPRDRCADEGEVRCTHPGECPRAESGSGPVAHGLVHGSPTMATSTPAKSLGSRTSGSLGEGRARPGIGRLPAPAYGNPRHQWITAIVAGTGRFSGCIKGNTRPFMRGWRRPGLCPAATRRGFLRPGERPPADRC